MERQGHVNFVIKLLLLLLLSLPGNNNMIVSIYCIVLLIIKDIHVQVLVLQTIMYM